MAAINAAVAAGVTLFDTANIYGDGIAETLLGASLSELSDVEIITKCGYVDEVSGAQDFSENAIMQSVESSLGRLQQSDVAALLLHSPPREVLEDGAACSVLDRLRSEGVASSTGVSLRSTEDWRAAIAWPGCTVVEVIYNLLDQRPMDVGLLRACEDRGIRVIARVPLCFGILSGQHDQGVPYGEGDQRSRWPSRQINAWIQAADSFRFLETTERTLTQAALAFVSSSPAVWAAIPGMKSKAQVLENTAAVTGALNEAEFEQARAKWRDVRNVVPS